MNLQNDPQSFALMKFGIGQPVRRTEDPMLVRGEGCYTDDIKLTGEAYAVMVRSRIAHGVIKGVDTTAARNMPGVLGVYTGADLAAYGTLKCIVPFNNRDGTPMKRPPRPALATDKVRFVGDPVARKGRSRGGRGRHRYPAGRGAAGGSGASGGAAHP